MPNNKEKYTCQCRNCLTTLLTEPCPREEANLLMKDLRIKGKCPIGPGCSYCGGEDHFDRRANTVEIRDLIERITGFGYGYTNTDGATIYIATDKQEEL
jgi:hypothetical protein